ncbi:imidazolonepropionase-like domain-containing protein, partial [Streptomyces phaeofaciens]
QLRRTWDSEPIERGAVVVEGDRVAAVGPLEERRASRLPTGGHAAARIPATGQPPLPVRLASTRRWTGPPMDGPADGRQAPHRAC